jgi:phosphoglucosamine mutase
MGETWQRPTGAGVGRVTEDLGLVDAYIAHLVSSLGADASLEGLTIVIDCANGAASTTALSAFAAQGATVVGIHQTPDGLNINDACGSTHMDDLQKAVVAHGADLGIALDGDADRCLAVDAAGSLVDGDQILAILAVSMKEHHELQSDTVVATVMSNLGFLHAMRAQGIRVDQTKVGDRYVLESMNANGFTLGGEQSGHVIMSEFATTGDGVLTGLHLTARLARTGKTLAELANVMTRLPQVMVNVRGVDKLRAGSDLAIKAAEAVRDRAGGAGHGGGADVRRGAGGLRVAGRHREGPGQSVVTRQRLVGTVVGALISVAGLVFAGLGGFFAYAGFDQPDVGSMLIVVGGFTVVIGLGLVGGGIAVMAWARRTRV